MTERQAASVWRTLRSQGVNASARFLEKGELAGQHVVEIEPRPSLEMGDFARLVTLAEERKIDLSYGKSPRRVLVLS